MPDQVSGNGGGVMNEIESFYGLIEGTSDALRVFEMCRQGSLKRVRRRLHERERKMIRSGSMFVFDEEESGIRRWTDGNLWSPSRILGNFLIYRELERSPSSLSATHIINNHQIYSSQQISPHRGQFGASSLLGPNSFRLLTSKKLQGVGSTADNPTKYGFKTNGLFKKTISAEIDGRVQHLVAYFNEEDFIWTHIQTTSVVPKAMAMVEMLRKTRIPTDLVLQQSFRKPSVDKGKHRQQLWLSVDSNPQSTTFVQKSIPQKRSYDAEHGYPVVFPKSAISSEELSLGLSLTLSDPQDLLHEHWYMEQQQHSTSLDSLFQTEENGTSITEAAMKGNADPVLTTSMESLENVIE